MSYQSKKLWDEVLDKIDHKYANEAAELFGRELSVSEEDNEYGVLVPIEAKKLPLIQSKRRFIGSIAGFVAAAAVLALSVGAAVRYVKKDSIIQSGPKDSSVSDENPITINENLFADIMIPVDPALYSEDYSIYEEYFCGRWKQSAGMMEYYNSRNKAYNIGYAPSDSCLFSNKTYWLNESIGFYEDGQGAYMADFSYREDGGVSNAEIVYSPVGDSDTLYLYTVSYAGDREPIQNPDKIFIRDGEYAEENLGALNYLGVRKLCGEMGIDLELLYKSMRYDNDGLRLVHQDGASILASDGVILNYLGEDRLEFAVKCAVVGNETTFYNVSVTKENGEWGGPVLADYTEAPVLLDRIPENTEVIDRDILEEYFLGEWRRDGLLNDKDSSSTSDNMSSFDNIAVMYSDFERESEIPGFVSVFRGDEGAFAYTVDGAVCFVPENDRQLMYLFADGDPLSFTVYRLSRCATAENRDLYGILTVLGREKLFDTLGSEFADTYYNWMESNSSTNVNGDIWGLDFDNEPEFLCVEELSSDSVSLVHKYFEKAGERKASLVSVFEKTDDSWEYVETYYDVGFDYTVFENDGDNIEQSNALTIYEDIFFGEWQCANAGAFDGNIVMSYSEEVFGTRLPYKGHDGYYMSRLNGGAFEMFFIPLADINSMYYYSEGTFLFDDSGNITTLKRDYSQKFVKTSKQLDKELRDMMPLSRTFGRYKLFNFADGNFEELFDDIVFSEDIVLDKNGVSWKSGIYQGYLGSGNFNPVLISLAEDRIIISQTFYQPQPEGVTNYDHDSTFENGKLKNFIISFTKQDGVWTGEISDAGEAVEAVIGFDMDMSIFPNFFGVWGDGEVSYTLDYYRDFCEAETSWISGFAETDSMWLMKVHRVDRGHSDVIPIKSGDAVYVIEKTDPDTVKVYTYADALPEGEPLRTFTRTEKLDTAFPNRGYISIYGLYALMDIIGDSGFESVIREYCFTGSVTAPDGRSLSADPSEISKSEYVILEKNSGKVKLATTFYDNKAYDYVVTFINEYGVNGGNNWHMSAYEPAIYGLADAEKIPLDNGSYYAFNDEHDGTHLYFFDSSDSIIYELDENADGAVYALNGNDLFVLKPVDEECVLTRYLGGKYGGGCVPATFMEYPEISELGVMIPESLEFKGDYLLAGFKSGETRYYSVCLPYEADIVVLLETDSLEIASNGFSVGKGENVKFYDVEGDSLECVLPLLRLRASQAWCALAMGTDVFDPAINQDFSLEKDGLIYYPASNPRFLSYSDFEKYLRGAFTDELAAEMLASTNVITDNDGHLYAIAGGRGSDISIADVRESEPKLIDKNTAEIIVEVYRWSNMSEDNWVMGEEPDEIYSHYLEKTVNGWRFSDFHEPY